MSGKDTGSLSNWLSDVAQGQPTMILENLSDEDYGDIDEEYDDYDDYDDDFYRDDSDYTADDEDADRPFKG